MRDVSQHVKGFRGVTEFMADDQLIEILRNLKRYGALGDLAKAARVSGRTLYRHAGDDIQRPDMGGNTRRAVVAVLAETGLLEPGDAKALTEALSALRKLAATSRAEDAGGRTAHRGKVGRVVRGTGKKDTG